MKFMWFHLMPYQELPEDFKSDHPSVWVDIDSNLFDPQKGHVLYNEYIDELKFAADSGFDAICVNEHHSNGYGLMPSPNLIASVLARETSEAAICVMGNSLALYNPPTRVAEEMAMIDCISGGRMISGFPVGTPMDTCFAYGQNPAKLRPRYYEAIDFIQRAWTTEETFSFNGRFNQQRYVNIWPRPVQKPHPPIWVPGGGSIETWQMCAERSFVYANLSYFGHLSSKASIDGFWGQMKELKKDPNPFHSAFLQTIGVAETRKEALELYSEPANYFYNRCLHIDPSFANPPGYATEATVRAKVESQVLRAAEVSRISSRTDQADVFEKGHVIIGSPDEVAEQIRDICLEMNVGHLMTLLHFGNMSMDVTRYNTDLFARKVIPQLKDLFEKDWQDDWWPQPLPKTGRVNQGSANEIAAE